MIFLLNIQDSFIVYRKAIAHSRIEILDFSKFLPFLLFTHLSYSFSCHN